jgi:DNA-binding transcriptional LysR family regulator
MLLHAMPAFQQQYPQIEIVLISVDDLAQIEEKSVDVLVRGRSLRQRGGQRPEPQGLIVRKLAQSRFLACASSKYLDRAGVPRAPADLLRHTCVAHLSLERDVQDEWDFVRAHERQKARVVPRLLVQGADALREAGVAGCGIIRINACHVEDELRSRQLIPILADWECTGSPPFVAIYRKTRPMPQQVSVFVMHLAEAFQCYNSPSKSPAR